MTKALRLLLFLLKSLLVALVVTGLCAFVFSYAMNLANVYILAKDGMETRAEIALTLTAQEEMTKFFTEEYAAEYLAEPSVYADYTIESIDCRIDIESLTCRAWTAAAQAVVQEQIPTLTGYLPVAKQTAEQLANPNKILPPAWQGARYRLDMIRVDGVWKIQSATLLEAVPTDPTPTPRPLDAATPVPVPTDTPKPSASSSAAPT